MADGISEIPIDPVLLNGNSSHARTPTSLLLEPTTDNQGRVLTPRVAFEARVHAVKAKQPLRDAITLTLKLATVPKGWNLEKLRKTLVNHWYPIGEPLGTTPQATTTVPAPELLLNGLSEYSLLSTDNREELPLLITPRDQSIQQAIIPGLGGTDDEAMLVNEFGACIAGADAHEVLGYDDDDDDDDEGGGEDDEAAESHTSSFQSYQTQLRLAAVQRAEGNRREGMSPTQGFSMDRYSNEASKSGSVNTPPSTPPTSVPNPFLQHRRDASGVYTAVDSTLRAFVNASPSSHVPREPTQVDLVLPPVEAFSDPGAAHLIWPPCLGQKSVRWADVFKLIKQPQLCWESWKPAKTLAQYVTVSELWDIFTSGEPVYHNGVQTGVRPPLRDVEQYFQHRWRTKGASNQKKAWERFREIPEYIDNQSTSHGISPAVVIDELETMRRIPAIGDGEPSKKGMNQLMREVQEKRKSVTHPPRPLIPEPEHSPSAMPSHSESLLQSPFLEQAHPKKRRQAINPRIRAKKTRLV